MPSATVATDPIIGFPRGRAREGHAEGDTVPHTLSTSTILLAVYLEGLGIVNKKKHFFAESATMYTWI